MIPSLIRKLRRESPNVFNHGLFVQDCRLDRSEPARWKASAAQLTGPIIVTLISPVNRILCYVQTRRNWTVLYHRDYYSFTVTCESGPADLFPLNLSQGRKRHGRP